MSEAQAPNGDALDKGLSPEQQQQVDVEVIPEVFERDKSPLVQNSAPNQISTDGSGYTTVTRSSASTLYNSDGKVEITILEAYLEARRQAEGRDVPVIVGGVPGDYTLWPSTCERPVVSIPSGGNVSRKYDLLRYQDGSRSRGVQADFVNFLIAQRAVDTYPGDVNYAAIHNYDVFYRKWDELIQKGKIKIVDVEKIKLLSSARPRSPSVAMATPEIRKEVGAAAWIAHFPEKKSLFVSKDDAKLKLFDWSDGIAANWSITELELPAEITPITAVGIDPRDNFLLVGSNNDFYVLDHHAKPIKVVKKITNPDARFDGTIVLKDDGSMLAGDKDGHLTKMLSNLHTFIPRRERLEQQRTLQLLRSQRRVQEFKGKQQAGVVENISPEVQAVSAELVAQFKDDIAKAASVDEIAQLKGELEASKADYSSTIKDAKIIDAIFRPVFDLLLAKETEILRAQMAEEIKVAQGLIARIGTMSLADLADARQRLERFRATVMGSFLPADTKKRIAQISDAFADKAAEVLGRDEDKLLLQLDALLLEARQKLEGIDKLSDFEVWQSTDYPAFLEALAGQMRIIPASHGRVIAKLREVETSIRDLKKEYAGKFKERYETVRQGAAARTDIMISLAADRIDEFLESFRDEVHKKSFRTPDEAKQWVERNPLYSSALTVVEDLATQEPKKAEELRQKLKVEVAQLAYEVKRLEDATVDNATGRQMAMFGKVAFPVWEHKVEGGQNVKIKLITKVDDSSKGPGIKPEDYMCELFYEVTDEKGKVHEIPVHAKDDRKYGHTDERYYDNGAYFPSYLTLGEARKVIAAIKAKESKRGNEITRKYEEFRAKIGELHGRISKEREAHGGDWSALKSERTQLTKDYITFLQTSGMYGWFALEAFKRGYGNGKNVENRTGQGRVPPWETYWVVDKDTEKHLEEIATMAEMSLDLKEGMISLEGHAGTGKDVLVQMFAHRTKRPYFSFDCSKWSTEFDLSQDIALESKNGASFTKLVDSIVVKALETPGAILYFNEFNALPIPAQIYLHSLLDAKRQITLKTSGSEVVKAHPDVLIFSSMNPKYPGTNDPQPATRRRMIPIQVGFPEFRKEDGTYAASEALRVAASVKSLKDLTYNPDMDENEFVKLWDGYINKGSGNGNLTPERKFDLEVIFALLSFAVEIRKGFINEISKVGGLNTFKVSELFTPAHMRRCAYILGSMDPSQKQDPDKAEGVAKNLVRQFFSQYIFVKKEAEALESNLAQWTTQKPNRAATTNP